MLDMCFRILLITSFFLGDQHVIFGINYGLIFFLENYARDETWGLKKLFPKKIQLFQSPSQPAASS